MPQTFAYVTVVVRDYDEAIAYITQMLDFDLIEDSLSTDRAGRDKGWGPDCSSRLARPQRTFSRKLPTKKKPPPVSATRLEVLYSRFFTRMISGVTTMPCERKE